MANTLAIEEILTQEDMAKVLATKEDLARLETRLTEKMMTAFIAITGVNLTAILGAVYFLFSALKK